MTWHVFDAEQKYISIGDVRITDEGLVVSLFDSRKNGDLVFPDFRSYRVSYERDLRKIIPPEVPREISITQDSQYLDWFRKNAEEDIRSAQLYHTMISDLAFIIDVISETWPIFRASNCK